MAGNHNVWVVCTCGYMYINMYLLIIFIKRTHCSRCLLCTGFYVAAAAAAKSLQSCPTLCDPIDGSPPGSAVPGILQARTLEWVAISFSNAWQWKVQVKSLSKCPTLCDPMDCSLPGSAVPGILQARTLEWVAISSSNAWKWKVKVKSLSKCPTLHDPMDCSPPGSSVHGIFQARVLEWGAIAFSRFLCC